MIKDKKAKTNILKKTTIFWFIVTLLGQWAFALYVILYYGGFIFLNGLNGIGEGHAPKGYVLGDVKGNIILSIHLITAVVIIAGGPLQLIPYIRIKFPKFHRWLGRFYMIFVLFGAIGGVYLTWSRPRPSFGSIYQDIAITIEALLIVVFVFLAYKYARKLKIKEHRRWALRLFITASGVWFIRIGYKAWYFIESLLGFKINNFFDYWSFGSFLIPLLVLELYLIVKDQKNKTNHLKMSALLFVVTVIMSIGIIIAIKEMWIPRIFNAI